jgi:glycosyltransferase involved in cell wall biosynthesis
MYFNNFVVMTDIASANDLTNNWSLWFIIPRNDTEELTKKLTYLIDNEPFLSDKIWSNKIHTFALEHFSWLKTVDAVWQKLNNFNNKK